MVPMPKHTNTHTGHRLGCVYVCVHIHTYTGVKTVNSYMDKKRSKTNVKLSSHNAQTVMKQFFERHRDRATRGHKIELRNTFIT